MDDLLGLNEINTNTNSHSNCYFEEEDKKEELYIKMIEDRIMFKIRKEIIEPLISDFNVKIDINTRQILKLKDDVSELNECVEREKNKNIKLTNQIDKLSSIISNFNVKIDINTRQILKLKDDVSKLNECVESKKNKNIELTNQIDKLSSIISTLKVYSPDFNDDDSIVNKRFLKDITIEKIEHQHQYTENVKKFSPKLYIKPFYNLKILQLYSAKIIDGQYLCSDYVTHLIIGYGSDKLKILNLKYLPLLNIIEIHNTWYTDLNELIKELSSYKHNIQHFIFTECDFIRNVKYQENFNNFKKYCEENNITLKITFAPPPVMMRL